MIMIHYGQGTATLADMKDFSGVFKLLNKFQIFSRSMNFSQNYLSIVSDPK